MPGPRRRGRRVAAITVAAAVVIAAAFLAGDLTAHLANTARRADRRPPTQPAGSSTVTIDPSPAVSPADRAGIATDRPAASPSVTSTTKTPSSPPSKPPSPAGSLDGTGPIQGLNGQCLDNLQNNLTDGNPIAAWVCDSSPAEIWTVADGRFSVGGKCMATAGGGSNAVVIATCNSSLSQVWQTTAADGSIRNPVTGGCLTATDNFTPVVVEPCNGNAGQRWTRKT